MQTREIPMANNDMDRVVPLGQLDDYKVAEGDPDVRGWEVLASDGRKIGEVDELLVDTNAMKVRYLDVDVEDGVIGDGMDRHVLIPIGYARLEQERDRVMVDGLSSTDLHALPAYDQGPLTRDFESSVRNSFSSRGTSGTSAGMAGAGAGLDTAGLDNTPGTGTGLGMTGAAGGLSGVSTGSRAETAHLGDSVPDGEGMRAAGYDLDRGTTTPLSTGADVRGTDSMRTGLDSTPGTTGGMSAGSTGGGLSSGGMSAGSMGGSASGPGIGGSNELGGTGRGDAMMGDDDQTLVGGMSAGAGSQGPVAGMGTDRGPQGDVSHRAGGSSGVAGSDYLHNADEDFYANDAFDDTRFYGSRRGGSGMSGMRTDASGMPDVGGVNPSSGAGMSGMSGGGSSGGAMAGSSSDPGGMGDSMGADRDETSRLAREAMELQREDHRNRGVGGSGGV
jgi:sporulation protein YlmC with PRC-barrel domain